MTRYVPIELPGLIGDEPLGFLAAIGLATQIMENSYLSWSPETHHAILHCRDSRFSSIDDLVSMLLRRLDEIQPGWAIPNQTNFPLRRRRGGPDPLRMRPYDYQGRELRPYKGGLSWLKAHTDQSGDRRPRVLRADPLHRHPRPPDHRSFWYYPMLEVKKDPRRLLTEALTGWRRVDGADGWLLDHHATYSTDPGIRGPSGSMAVPGATWLATLAVHKFPFQDRSTLKGVL